MTRSTLRAQRGFTLIELLITMSIVVFLAGMSMPLIAIAKKASLKTVTLSTMTKTEAALTQFKTDFKVYPYQLTYNQDGESWTNTLNYTIGSDITTTPNGGAAALVKADMATAAANYAYTFNGNYTPVGAQAFQLNRNNGSLLGDGSGNPESDAAPSGTTYNAGQGVYYWTYPGNIYEICIMLDRLASERANDIVLSGNITAGGVTMQKMTGPGGLVHNGRDLSASPLIAGQAQSAANPGWARDYLQGEIDAKYLSGTAILDAYLHPLIYVCQAVPGVEVTWGQVVGGIQNEVDIPTPAIYGLAPIGRQTLQPCVPGTSTPIVGDQYLPDVTNLIHSDRRYWAAPGLELEFELWSAGPDGVFSWWRDDASNRDNISCEPYDHLIGQQP